MERRESCSKVCTTVFKSLSHAGPFTTQQSKEEERKEKNVLVFTFMLTESCIQLYSSFLNAFYHMVNRLPEEMLSEDSHESQGH